MATADFPVGRARPARHRSARSSLGRATFVAGAAAVGGVLFGYDSAVINGALTGIESRFDVSSATTGTIVAVALLGSAVGAGVAGRLADRIGRLRVMHLAAALFAVSAVGSAVPFALWDLAMWRVLGGVAIGIASLIGPTYIAEVAPAEYRGRLASFQQAAIVLGITASQIVNWLLARAAGGGSELQLGPLEAWQWMFLAAGVPAVVYFVLTSRIPESPYYLIAQRRFDEARASLSEVEDPGVDLDGRIAEIQRAQDQEHHSRLRDLLGGRLGLLPIVWVGVGLAVFQQLVGINVIFYYSSLLWQSVGIAQTDSLLLSVSTSLVNIVGTVVAMLLIDRVGRRPLALVGSAGMAVSLATASWAFSSRVGSSGEDFTMPHSQAVVAIVAAHVFVLFFASSWGVILWVLVGEIFPLRIRSAAMSLATASNWIANWAVTETFPPLSDWNLSATYGMYAAFSLVSIAFVLLFVRETTGKQLQDMD